MSILVNRNTRVITQGMTGKTGAFHTEPCRDYANPENFVAGVNPRKAGEEMDGIPILVPWRKLRLQRGLMRPLSTCRLHSQLMPLLKLWRQNSISLFVSLRGFRSWICSVCGA